MARANCLRAAGPRVGGGVVLAALVLSGCAGNATGGSSSRAGTPTPTSTQDESARLADQRAYAACQLLKEASEPGNSDQQILDALRAAEQEADAARAIDGYWFGLSADLGNQVETTEKFFGGERLQSWEKSDWYSYRDACKPRYGRPAWTVDIGPDPVPGIPSRFS